MVSQVCLVTGASSGIGKETVAELARAKVDQILMICRDRDRGEESAKEVRRHGGSCEVFIADLAVQRDVRRVAREIVARYGRLDVLVHNAGAVHREREVTPDGVEKTLAVNHLAPFLLTNLLLESLKRAGTPAAPARIVVVASQVEKKGRIDFEDLHGERRYEPLTAYFQSKLANVLFTYALARRLEGTHVTANCMHPGVIATTLLANYLGKSSLGIRDRLTTPGPAGPAKMLTRLAIDAAYREVSGAYFHETRRAESSPASRDRALQERLWDVSEGLVAKSHDS